MRRVSLFLFLQALLATACADTTAEQVYPPANDVLLVSGGSAQKRYTKHDLQTLNTTQASFLEVNYVGVSLAALLRDAGFDPEKIKAVKAIAVDGFSANYDPELVNKSDTVVAYDRAEGPLAEGEAPYRMVLPGQEGKLNVRQMIEIQVIP